MVDCHHDVSPRVISPLVVDIKVDAVIGLICTACRNWLDVDVRLNKVENEDTPESILDGCWMGCLLVAVVDRFESLTDL